LSAAKLLEEAGVRDVLVFEARPVPGGKSLTILEDGALHELGTCYSTLAHRATNRWMRDFGIAQVPLGRQMFDGEPFVRYLRAGPGGPLVAEIARFVQLWTRHRADLARRPEDPRVLAECAELIGDWLARNRLVRMRRFMHRALTTMGYGFLDEVPACQALRWCTPTMLATGVLGGIRMPKGGWQSFWTRLAAGLKVRLGEPVTEVVREGPGGTLVTPMTTCRFEHLLVTIPLDDFAALTPPTAAEERVAQAISWGRYVTSLVRVDGWFTSYETDAFSRAAEPGAERGRLLAARRPPRPLRRSRLRATGELYVCGQYGAHDEAELARMLHSDIASRGGRLVDVLQQKVWRYAPRYSADAIRSGLLGEMARIQGECRTWYSGASFSHEAVSNITNFNERLVRDIVRRLGR
jgi:hypothetical protein